MAESTSVALTLLAGFAGGVTAHHLRLPGGAILWALIPVIAVRLLFEGFEPLGAEYRVAAQILIGTAVGSILTRSPLKALRPLLVPVAAMLAALLAVAVASGFLFAAVTDLSLLTTLFSTAPGGASDMAAAALQLDADAALIAGFHLVRQLAIFVVLAGVFARVFRVEPEGEEGPP